MSRIEEDRITSLIGETILDTYDGEEVVLLDYVFYCGQPYLIVRNQDGDVIEGESDDYELA